MVDGCSFEMRLGTLSVVPSGICHIIEVKSFAPVLSFLLIVK